MSNGWQLLQQIMLWSPQSSRWMDAGGYLVPSFFLTSIVKSESHLARQWASSVPIRTTVMFQRALVPLLHPFHECCWSPSVIPLGIHSLRFQCQLFLSRWFWKLELLSPILVFGHFLAVDSHHYCLNPSIHPFLTESFPWSVSSSREREETWCSLTNYVKQHSHSAHSP